MKILLSAFACGPNSGSEPGVGWNWAINGARLGHQVHVITTSEYRNEIEELIASGTLPEGLTFDMFMPRWIERICNFGLKAGFENITWNLTHLLWQFALLRFVRENKSESDFDVVHHITLGGCRQPTLLYKSGMPLVVGPVGGGERTPITLRRSFPWSGQAYDLLRDAINLVAAVDPITRQSCAQSIAYYARTKDTVEFLPMKLRDKARICLELGIYDNSKSNPPITRNRSPNEPVRILYAGLLTYRKGMELGLRAFADVCRRDRNVHLTMVGRGPQAQRWQQLATQLGIADRVTWLGWVDFSDMPKVYREHDFFLFPSLRDSGGTVVVEALSNGLPVVCLALGGPNEIVKSYCGRSVSVENGDEQDVVNRLANVIDEIASDDELLGELSQGALKRAGDFSWPKVVGRLYGEVEKDLAKLAESKTG
ncbi:MAG: glycosyltransferase family 4 protein [Hyphomicrobiaceae bacterium]